MMRQRFFQQLDAMAAGEEPKATIRDPVLNRCIPLPIIGRRQLIEGVTRAEVQAGGPRGGDIPRRDFPYLYGQPESIRRDYEAAMGFVSPSEEAPH
jgi:5,5'-dehydrodivanillate O-demethylase